LIRKLDDDDPFDEGDSRYLAKEVLTESCEPLEVPSRSKCDIFSLGLTVYQLATLKNLPSSGDEWDRIREGHLEFPSNLSPEFCSLIKLMAHPDPKIRPSAHDLMYHPLIFPSNRSNLEDVNDKFKVWKKVIKK
jgi:serine/threonine protein kinase